MVEIRIIEIFDSIQGEGLIIGVPCTFIRLAICNLRCVDCDTKYSWDPGIPMKLEDILAKINKNYDWVTITGGEPLVQQRNLVHLVRELKKIGKKIVIETSGSIVPNDELLELIDLWSVSPKLKRFEPHYPKPVPFNKVLSKVAHKTYYKFVITNLREELQELLELIPPDLPSERIVLQPNWYRLSYEQLVKEAIELGLKYRVLPQLHKFIGAR